MVSLIDISEEKNDAHVLINPEIVETSGEQTGYEGCLSVPGKVGTVTRPEYVKCRAFNENMEEVFLEGTGLLGRAIAHELDHLEGKLYVNLVEGELLDADAAEEELPEEGYPEEEAEGPAEKDGEGTS